MAGEVEPLLVTEDELVAMALLRGKPCPVPVRTVDLDDAADVRRSLGRGVRSMRLRGLLDEKAETDIALQPLEEAARGELVALVAAVDEADRPAVVSPYVAVLVWGEPRADRAVLMRSDPDGTIALSAISTIESVDALVSCVTDDVGEGERLAMTLRRPGIGLRGGVLRTREGFFRMSMSGGGSSGADREMDAHGVRELVAASVTGAATGSPG